MREQGPGRGLLPFFRAALGALLLALQPFAAAAATRVTVEIVGLDAQAEANARQFLGIARQDDIEDLGPARVRRLHRNAAGEIAAALKPYGYYRPTVDSRLLREADDRWRAIYTVTPGEPIRIASVAFTLGGEMSEDPEFVGLVEDGKPEVGEVFSHLEYEGFKSSLARLANERGYFDARFVTQRVEIDTTAYEVRVFLEYAGGQRYRFGEIQVDQDVLDDELLNRFVPFVRGDPYLLDRVIALQRALNNSDYFQVVEITPGEPEAETLEVPIQVRLVARNRHRFDIGAGYGTDTGARAQFGWQMPRINTRGHRFDTRLRISEIGHSLLANYRIPVLDPRTDQLIFSAGEVEEEFDNGVSTVRTVGVSLGHSRGAWRELLSLEYQREEYPAGEERDKSELLIPGIGWSRTWGGDFINVLDGLRYDLQLRGADDGWVSDTSFAQLETGVKFITSFGPRDRVLARGWLGTTEASEFERIPSSLRFFAGGSNSVRGYSYQSLGPTDADGDVVGGKHLMTGSIEYEHYFDDRWGGALFFDVGNAMDSLGDDLERGAGFGLRWKSPVGPVRVDLGNAITGSGNWRLHIFIGPDL